MALLYGGREAGWPEWGPALTEALAEAGIDIAVTRGTDAPDSVRYIAYAPGGPITDFAPFTGLRAILSLWAGVERVLANPTLPQGVPLCRMVDEGLRQGMVEWVVAQVLRHHLGLDAHLQGQDGIWREGPPPPLAPERGVAVLGLGELGAAVAQAVARLGFAVTGWSRRPRMIEGVTCRSGEDGLSATLSGAEILVCLLPETAATTDLLDATRLGLLPRGAIIINPGRGTLIEDKPLLAALDSGALGHATLDVFRTEPLPPSHPFWAHPRITVSPHVAAATRPRTAARAVAANIARAEAGLPLLHVVDREAGY